MNSPASHATFFRAEAVAVQGRLFAFRKITSATENGTSHRFVIAIWDKERITNSERLKRILAGAMVLKFRDWNITFNKVGHRLIAPVIHYLSAYTNVGSIATFTHIGFTSYAVIFSRWKHALFQLPVSHRFHVASRNRPYAGPLVPCGDRLRHAPPGGAANAASG